MDAPVFFLAVSSYHQEWKQNVLVMQNEPLNLFHHLLPSGYEWHKRPYPALVLAVLTSFI